ncbi:hypothetical protein [Flavobacterium sp. GCM10027622]|uniref:hypothetical protein n=1 Tax=unclassified Flavobacterium TaxID=196869 RepID=UPI003605E4B6
MNTFKQSKFFITREFEITETHLNYRVLKYGNETELKIPFENLREKTSFRNLNIEFLFIAGFFGLLASLSVFWKMEDETIDSGMIFFFGSVSIGFLLYFIIGRVNQWRIRLSNNQYVFINKKNPSQSQTEDFINAIYEAQKEYLRSNYLIIDSRLNYENQVETLKWLKSLNAISQEEYKQKYEELRKLILPEKRTIGFEK